MSYVWGFDVVTHAKSYLDKRGRLDLDSEGVLLQAQRDVLDAIEARAFRYLEDGAKPSVMPSFEPVAPSRASSARFKRWHYYAASAALLVLWACLIKWWPN